MRIARPGLALSLLAVSAFALPAARARAQTLTVELGAEVSVRDEALTAAPSPRLEAPPSASPAYPAYPGSPGALIVVRPPDASDNASLVAQDVGPSYAATVQVVEAPPVAHAAPVAYAGAAPAPVEPTSSTPEIEGAVWMGLFVDGGDLVRSALTFRDPEVQALGGVTLEPGWEGNAQLHEVLSGGFTWGFGMRVHEILRGPELRMSFGGGEVSGPFVAAPGAPELSLAVRSVLALRVETAVGLQAPLGPLTPYILGRAAAGAVWVDLAVEHAELGALGRETVDTGVAELGLEAGVAVDLGDGLELGMAFRASFLGTETLGGLLTLGCHG